MCIKTDLTPFQGKRVSIITKAVHQHSGVLKTLADNGLMLDDRFVFYHAIESIAPVAEKKGKKE